MLTLRTASLRRFNSPREVSCLPTCFTALWCSACQRRFNSPREVSCLPTCLTRRSWHERLRWFQFPTGSVLSADRLSRRCVWRRYSSFNSPREVSCLPTADTTTAMTAARRVSIPHGKCPVCRRRPAPRGQPASGQFQFPTGSVLSADKVSLMSNKKVTYVFQFPTGSVLSADFPIALPDGPAYPRFQFPTGSVLSADAAGMGSGDQRLQGFQFPTGSVLSADRANTPAATRALGVSIPHGKCPVCRPSTPMVPTRAFSAVSIPHGKCPVCRLSRRPAN